MTLVVADASPISYLLILEAGQVLPQLYDRVVIPQTVLAELTHPHAPAVARNWASALPDWTEVRTASHIQLEGKLDPGEAEAIALAQELNADCVLLDDRDARREAIGLGLTVAGTIGVLEQAAERGLIDLPGAFQRLLATNFRIDRRFLEDALSRDAARKERQRPRQQDRSIEP